MSQLWTVLKNGNKVNVLGVDGLVAWADKNWGSRPEYGPPFLTYFKAALEDPGKECIQIRDAGASWVLARITE